MNLDIDIEESNDQYKAEIVFYGNIYRVSEPKSHGVEVFTHAIASKIRQLAFPESAKEIVASFTTLYHLDRFQKSESDEPIYRVRCNCGAVSDSFHKRTTNPIDWPEFQQFRTHQCQPI